MCWLIRERERERCYKGVSTFISNGREEEGGGGYRDRETHACCKGVSKFTKPTKITVTSSFKE